jgi:hypothetical protein
MEHKGKSIRPFIGSKNFGISRQFYKDLGFRESILANNLSYFESNGLGFYLQDAYVKDWIDNTMVFMEVDDIHRFWSELAALDITSAYEHVRIVPIRHMDWGSECFLHDPSGILWHFGEFKNR